MATARTIGLSPSFQILNEAVLLNQDAQVYGQKFDLVEVANTALERNQDLQAARFGLLASENEINRARSGLFPQIGVIGSYTTRNDSPSVNLGLFPEQTADVAVSLDQLIYSDPVAAGVTIQTELQASREAELRELRLDVVQAATTAYYLVLNAESQLRIQESNLRVSRTNLELAQNRVTLGISTLSDVYRWEAEVARAQIIVVSAQV